MKDNKRDKVIVRTSIFGIMANVLLSVFKMFVGLISGSIAIVLDSVNNISDALSSIVTIAGIKLSARQPDKKHPFGFGRIEYISSMVVALIILYIGATSIVASIKKIINPVEVEYSSVTLIILVVAVLVKVFLGLYVKKMGKSVKSDALFASGQDALFDAIISTSVLLAALVYNFTGISIESYLGVLISIFILKAGFEILLQTLSDILGQRVDSSLSLAVKKTILQFDDVISVNDLIIHNYGPRTLVGSVHISLPEDMTVKEVNNIEHEITRKVMQEHKVFMGGISVYAINKSEKTGMEKEISAVIKEYPEVIGMHGFYSNIEEKYVRFDIVIDYATKKRAEIYDEIQARIENMYSDYNIDITLDADISD